MARQSLYHMATMRDSLTLLVWSLDERKCIGRVEQWAKKFKKVEYCYSDEK